LPPLRSSSGAALVSFLTVFYDATLTDAAASVHPRALTHAPAELLTVAHDQLWLEARHAARERLELHARPEAVRDAEVQQSERGEGALGPRLLGVAQHEAPVAVPACARLPVEASVHAARRSGVVELVQQGRWRAPAAPDAQLQAAASDGKVEQQMECGALRARQFRGVAQQEPPGLVVMGARQQMVLDAVRWLQEAPLGQAPAVSTRRRGR
jgi:hypothetical protein